MDKNLLIKNQTEYKKEVLYDRIFIGVVLFILAFLQIKRR